MVFDDLAKLLEPCLSEEFLATSWGKSYRHIRGWPGKFARLLPWNELNEILMRHRLDYPRLRLMQDGKSVQTSSYLRHATSGGQRKVSIPRLRHVELTKHLRDGATLVLDAVDELCPPVRELAEALEFIFHEHVQVNCYAGWRTQRGFDLHWDDHDVFILQVTGRKRWSVYGMTQPFPLTREGDTVPKPAPDNPLWTETLEDGDLLYIPRGWWHVALPLDEPTLHLTVGIHNRTGIDLLQWLAVRLRASETFRQDLPRHASGEERAKHLENLRRDLLKELEDSNLLERYYEELDASAEPRAHLSLPWSATPDALPEGDQVLLRLHVPRPLDLEAVEGVVEFSCNKKRWRFAAAALPVLQALNERRACSVRTLCDAASGKPDEQVVLKFLRELLLQGLIVVVNR
jgi:ribosomal protein L16 Arg81 hydroxylase